MAKADNHSKDIESGQHLRYNLVQELIDDVTLFTLQSSAKFYDELFRALDVEYREQKPGVEDFQRKQCSMPSSSALARVLGTLQICRII